MNESLPQSIREKLNLLSKKPGVYLFRNKSGELIYVGKAKVLRNRVRSYFQAGRPRDAKTARLVSQIADLETIITDSEVEALILESNLVKEYKPRYNINLKDDKSFPYIRVTHEPFPRIFPTRKIIRDGSRYFGPYTDASAMKELLKTVKQLFPLRSCNLLLTEESIQQHKFRVCLNFHIKKCHGPCEAHISRAEYQKTIHFIVSFIEGKSNAVVEAMTREMAAAAADRRFEEAARLRDQLQAVQAFRQHQKVLDPNLRDRDIIAIAMAEGDACCVVFQVREGKIIGRHHFFLAGINEDQPGAVAAGFVKQYYLNREYTPAEILLPTGLGEETAAIRDWLTSKRGSTVELVVPQRGEKAQILKMCDRNARLLLQEMQLQREQSQDYTAGSVKALQRDLAMEKLPLRIEAFDISNIQGSDPVASMVCFVNGKAHRSDYRHFRIRTKSTPDDFAMMREAVTRRYRRLLQEEKALPDLILVDGGKGQLNAALEALGSLGIKDQAIIALAKRLDEVFVPGESEPRNIRRDSAGLRLLQRVRDEAHRFAITFHRSLRKRRTLVSELEAIPGVGKARRDALLKAFKSVKKIKEAGAPELRTVAGIPAKLAETIWTFYHPTEEAEKGEGMQVSQGKANLETAE
ncbi:MAG TPA: excinuclease ABC subunit UvrC [bacterium]|nr:excinuclease ABC subunit UvrC [bacterium]HQI48818.1 excinuclease ABC subunit UvrC [bacterium]HQJ65567.1 excinuclease ABC subunit UvrC [bacterium]